MVLFTLMNSMQPSLSTVPYHYALQADRIHSYAFHYMHICDSVLQIEYKQLTQKLTRQEEQNESLARQLEQLNAENVDLQHQTTELTSNLHAMQLERDTLQQSLEEFSEQCSKLQSELSSIRNDNEVLKDLPQSTPPLTAARLEGEKAKIMTELESVNHELSVMKETVETQKNKISQLEASIELLTVERDAATSLLAEVSAVNLTLPSLSSETTELMSIVDKKSKELVSVEVEKAQALSKVSTLEDIVKDLQTNSKRLIDELASSKSEISMLLSQIELANQRPIEDEGTNDVSASILDSGSPNVIKEYEAKVNALQSEIDSLKCARKLSAIQVDTHTSPQITIEEDQKMNTGMTELRDYNVALQEAIQGNQS